jgi:sporulation protein YqfC
MRKRRDRKKPDVEMSGMQEKRKSGLQTESPENRKRVREKITELLELPKEIVLNIPRITMIGSSDMIVENYKGIIEYENERIRLNTGSGPIAVKGSKLEIREITSEDIIISGDIRSLEFYK